MKIMETDVYRMIWSDTNSDVRRLIGIANENSKDDLELGNVYLGLAKERLDIYCQSMTKSFECAQSKIERQVGKLKRLILKTDSNLKNVLEATV